MTRLMRSGGVLVVMLLGLACGGGSIEAFELLSLPGM